jgi:excisionase family DNA binding protein
MSEYVTGAQAAALLGVSESLVRKRIKSGALRATKDGRRWRIRRADLDADRTGPEDERTATAQSAQGTAPAPHRTGSTPHRTRTDTAQWRADLLAQIDGRDAHIAALTEQNQALAVQVREALEAGREDALQLANRIADLVDRHQDAEARIIELQPVAEQVPMLQAAVDEKDAELSGMHADIDAIASRPVTGPVFRLLTKGKLRR